jgi:hypothetical protein
MRGESDAAGRTAPPSPLREGGGEARQWSGCLQESGRWEECPDCGTLRSLTMGSGGTLSDHI